MNCLVVILRLDWTNLGGG